MYFHYNLGQRANNLRLRIYDVAGHKVAEFETMDFTQLTTGKLRWDLRNDHGDRIANGVYIYKFEATRNGKTQKVIKKLAVLR